MAISVPEQGRLRHPISYFRTELYATPAYRSDTPWCIRAVYDWCRRYDERGRAAFIHGSTGKRTGQRIAVSRRFDAAFSKAFLQAGGSQEALGRALDELRDYVNLRAKAEWASATGRAGADQVRYIVSGSLKEDYFQKPVAGILVTLPAHFYTVTRDRVDKPAFRNCRIVDEMRHDRKKFHDDAPRISRDWSQLAPMEWVIADVKPLDVAVERPDGSVAYPRMVAFLDAGTQRLFYRAFLCPKGQAIRQKHIIKTFMDMVRDPEWGVPRRLYLDNGSEFAAFDKIAHFLNQIAPEGKKSVVKAIAHNAAAKPIEGIFGSRLDRYVISQMSGWTGGDRMKSKVANVGKKPDTYPGSFEAFRAELAARIQELMLRSMKGERGQWGELSAQKTFENKQKDGWFPIVPLNSFALEMAFWKRARKTINRGAIHHNGRKFWHPDLPTNGTFEALISPDRDDALILLLGDGRAIGLREDYPSHPFDQEGARESGRRKARHLKKVRDLTRSLPPSDADRVRRSRIEAANASRPATVPMPIVPTVDTGGENDRIAQAVATAKQTSPQLSARDAEKAAANQQLMLMENKFREKVT